MKNIAILLAYDGSQFFGWQKSDTLDTIEGALSKALKQLLGKVPFLQAASRTDRGVHAYGQVVNFMLEKPTSLEKLKRGLNALLKKEIEVLAIKEVDPSFHPTVMAKKKAYLYYIDTKQKPLPFHTPYIWHVPQKLKLEKIENALPFFLGEKDFGSFQNKHNDTPSDTVRKIDTLSFSSLGDGLYQFLVIGNSFLYKMVRNIIGALIYMGRGKITPDELIKAFLEKNRNRLFVTAPANGLFLKEVFYEKPLFLKEEYLSCDPFRLYEK